MPFLKAARSCIPAFSDKYASTSSNLIANKLSPPFYVSSRSFPITPPSSADRCCRLNPCCRPISRPSRCVSNNLSICLFLEYSVSGPFFYGWASIFLVTLSFLSLAISISLPLKRQFSSQAAQSRYQSVHEFCLNLHVLQRG
jgi:hypothetical protein